MTVITSTADQVLLLKPDTAVTINAICGTTLSKGELVYWNSSSGKLVKSNASAAGTAKCIGMALEDGVTNQTISVLVRGLVGGFSLSNGYGTEIYASDTAGALDTAAGTVSLVVGRVFPLPDVASGPTKALYVNSPSL